MNVMQFIQVFTGEQVVASRDIVLLGGSVYAVPESLKEIVSKSKRSAFAVGMYLGMERHGKFFPSFQLLDLLMPLTQKRVVLTSKASWLVVCGRDVLKQGVQSAPDGLTAGDLVLLENQYGECIGLGQWSDDKKVRVKRLVDRGDFLRRER